MISEALLSQAHQFAYQSAEEYGVPLKFHLDLSNHKGQWLARQLNAQAEVVLLGTLLMDCMLGPAIQAKKQPEHVEMSAKKAEEILATFPEVTTDEKENILWCVRQHHGGVKFFSLESEICCNADCYRFASTTGLIGALRFFRDFPLPDLVTLAQNKVEEKWQALSLEICKQELEPEYQVNKQLLAKFKLPESSGA